MALIKAHSGIYLESMGVAEKIAQTK